MYGQIIQRDDGLSREILVCLPQKLQNELLKIPFDEINEIRLRVGGACCVKRDGKKALYFPFTLSRDETDEIVKRMCGGSVYAHRDTINQGYISLGGGVRVGICGRAVYDTGRLVGVYDVSSLCIRVPHRVTSVGENVCRLMLESELSCGVLIYSPPGIGKTTLLRGVTKRLASPPSSLSVAVIDTRGELSFGLEGNLCCDILSGYPKSYGIELATRALCPDLIVCDEIGSDITEACAIKAALNSGVPLLASAHAADVPSLLKRPAIAELHRASCFGYYIGIRRKERERDYVYSVTRRAEAEKYAR